MRPVAHLWQAGAHRWVGNWFSGKQTLGGEVWLLGLKALDFLMLRGGSPGRRSQPTRDSQPLAFLLAVFCLVYATSSVVLAPRY
jgi:hypothetical protein